MALVAVVALLAVVVLAVAGWWLWGRGTSDERVAETTANETPPPTRTEPVSGQPLGRLVVTAAPWARLVEISNEGGFLQDLPADRHTPLTLELAPGTYRITLEYGDDPLFFAPAAAPGSESVAEDGEGEPSGDPVVGGVADDSVPSSDPQTCEVVVATTTVARCDLVFEGPEALDYFKEAGWWQ